MSDQLPAMFTRRLTRQVHLELCPVVKCVRVENFRRILKINVFLFRVGNIQGQPIDDKTKI